MSESNIQDDLDNLGKKVSTMAEENRLYKIRNDAGQELFTKLNDYISTEDWIKIFESTSNPFVKDIMREWGLHLFPKKYKI